MSLVTMPDGTEVEMPDQITPELATRLKALQASQQPKPVELAQPEKSSVQQAWDAVKNVVGGTVEPVLQQATGMIGKTAGEVAGVGAIPLHAAGMIQTEPAQVQQNVQQALTYKPMTQLGQSETNPLNAIPALAGRAVGAMQPPQAQDGSTVGGMIQNAARETVPQLINIAGTVAGAAKPRPKLNMKQQVFEEGKNHGYVATPTAVGSTKLGAAAESISNKAKITAKTSMINAEARTMDIRKDLGLSEGATIAPEELEAIRENAAKATQAITDSKPVLNISNDFRKNVAKLVSEYSYLKNKFPALAEGPAGAVLKGKAQVLYNKTLKTDDALKLIQNLRRQADADLSAPTGKKIAPAQQGMGEFNYYLAKAIEDEVGNNLKDAPDLLKQFQDARTITAKTYDVQSALNHATGEVIGSKLANAYDKNPAKFSGALKRAAEHAKSFPGDNKDISRMGGHPPLSAWDFLVTGGTAMAGHPGIAAAELGSRVGIPTILASKFMQNRMLPQAVEASPTLRAAAALTPAEVERQRRKRERASK